MNPFGLVFYIVGSMLWVATLFTQPITLDPESIVRLFERFGGLLMFGLYVWWREKKLAEENARINEERMHLQRELKECQEARIREARVDKPPRR